MHYYLLVEISCVVCGVGGDDVVGDGIGVADSILVDGVMIVSGGQVELLA